MHNKTQTANRVLSRCGTLAVLTCLAAITVALATPAIALAKPKRPGKAHGAAPKVGLMTFTGPGEAASRAAGEKALKSRKIVVPAAQLAASAKSAHVRLDGNDGFRAVAKALDLTAIVSGEVSKKKATITVRTGDDGSSVGEEAFPGADPRKVAATISKTFWKRLAGAFNRTKPPSGGNFEAPPPEEEPATGGAEAANEEKTEAPTPSAAASARKGEAEDTSESKEEKAETKPARKSEAASSEAEEGPAPSSPAVDIMAGPAWFMRSLSFNQARNDLSNTKVASYSLPRAPALFFRGDIFPAALAGATGFAADLGLTADLSYLLPVVTSKGVDGDYKTTGLAYALGVKARLPLGTFLSVSYGGQAFKLTKSNSNMPDAVIPGVSYKFARVGAGIRGQVTPSLMLQANLGYLQCLGKPGDIAASPYFPRTKCNGFEAGVGAGYRLAGSWEIRAGVDWRRFGLSFNVKPGDVTTDPGSTPAVAGGAIDQFIQVYAGLAYAFGGGGSADAPAAEPSDAKADKSAKADKADKSDDDDSSEGGE
jgi:hypothetical protein